MRRGHPSRHIVLGSGEIAIAASFEFAQPSDNPLAVESRGSHHKALLVTEMGNSRLPGPRPEFPQRAIEFSLQ